MIIEALRASLADRYRIERELGQGGMATVYLAQDLKHDRQVALKVLRPELAAVIGADRFLAEIKTTANLQHPHILPLFDSGQIVAPPLREGERGTAGGEVFLYYVMPFIEGDTLRDLIAREKQLPIDTAIAIASEVLDALDYAHRHGVIHRDIKPENILLHDGRALVADFGIALAVSSASDNRMTETGMSLGTPHYMSPEQAMGERNLDQRSDVYSVGAMLYEMLTGDPPHHGSTAQAIVAQILTEEARPLDGRRKTVPPFVAAAVHQALAKLPADRFTSADTFRHALHDPSFSPATTRTLAAPTTASSPITRNRLVLTAVGTMVALVLAFLGGRRSTPTPSSRLIQFSIPLPDSVSGIGRCCGGGVLLSPDGTTLVFEATVGSKGFMYRRSLDALAAAPIPGTDGASSPFFSPDGRWVGFLLDGKLRKVSLAGGPPVAITSVDGLVRGASWGDDDTIIFANSNDGRLYTVPASGGVPTEVSQPTTGRHLHPQMLPGARAVLLTLDEGGGLESYQVGILHLDSGTIDTVVTGTDARYASGYLLFTGADASLLAQPFDPRKGATTGPAVALFDGVLVRGDGTAELAVSSQGGLAYVPGVVGGGTEEELLLIDGDRREALTLPQGTNFESPAFSPTGDMIAIRLAGMSDQQDIWIFDRGQGTLTRFTVEGENDRPVWTTDGRRIVYSTRGASSGIAWKRADGSDSPEIIYRTKNATEPGEWLPDGQRLVLVEQRAGSREDIGILSLGDSVPTWIVATPFRERHPSVSPDGRWLAYISDRSGSNEVYVVDISGQGARHQISAAGGTSPHWSPDGKTLYYLVRGEMMSASLQTSDFRVRARTPLFSGQFDENTLGTNYDINRQNGTFLMISQDVVGLEAKMTWILNWPEIIRKMGTTQ